MDTSRNDGHTQTELEESMKGFSIGKFSVRNPVLVNILMVTVLALGIFSLIRLPQEQFAEVPFYWVNVIVPYPGVSAEDMEETVTIPVENQFQGIDRLKQIVSTTSEGLSVVRVEFDDGISKDEFRALYQEAQTRFSQADLPDGILSSEVDDFSSADFLPVIEVVVSGDIPNLELRDEAEKLRDRLLRVKEVSNVELVGAPERQIILDADPDRMQALGMTTGELLRAVQDQNQTVPGGTLTTASREYLLRTIGDVESAEDFSDIIVRRSDETGGIVRVDDVVNVIDGVDPDSPKTRFNGDKAISLRITKIPGGSSVDVVSGTRRIVEEAEDEIPWGINLTLFNDSTVQIASSLSVLTSNALMGLFLLVIILWLFIGFRNAMITALGIPVTFALTFLALDLFGETVNTNTLFGLVLVLGLIVDHAIVIIENSYRLRQNGLLRHDAAIIGTNQVVLPVIAATATTVAAFLPLMIIPGTIGKFLRVIPLTVAIALIASTGEALFFLPSHFADWGKDPSEKKGKKRKKEKREPGSWFNSIRKRYDKLIFHAYNRKGLVLILVLVIAAGSFSLIGGLQQDLFSAEDYSYFTIDISMPTGTPLEETNRVVEEFESVLLPKRGNGEVLSILSSVGTALGGTGSTNNSNVAQILVDLTEKDEGRLRSIDDIITETEWETYYIPGPEQVLFRKAQNGPPTSAALSFRVYGDNYEQLISASNKLQASLSTVDGVSNVEDDYSAGSPELRIRVNQERASALGISVGSLGNYIRARFDGIPVGSFFTNNKEIDVVLQFDSGQARNYEELEQALIPTEDGRLVPFTSVARVVQDVSVGSIRRLDGKREITISADALDSVDLGEVNASIEELWNEELAAQFPETSFAVGGEFSEFQDLLLDILRVFLLGIFLIYLILGTQFNSYKQPFLIIFAIPFAFVGVVLFLAVSGTPFSTTVLYAGVALAGIAVNDAIVLISFINELRKKQGLPVREAVLQAAGTRLRPIVLTSLTTIMGLLPTAIGIGGTSVVWGPMASTIIFGLIFSTLTALIIIPLLYGLFFDKKAKKGDGGEGSDKPASERPKRRGGVKRRLYHAKQLKTTETAFAGLLLGLGALVLSGLFSPVGLIHAETADDEAALPGSFVSGYPELYSFSEGRSREIDTSQLNVSDIENFLDEWAMNSAEQQAMSFSDMLSMLDATLDKGTPSLDQLESASRIQEAQVKNLEQSRFPNFSIVTDPAQTPLYSYSRIETVPSATSLVESHSFGAGLSASYDLPTAGNLSASLNQSTSYSLKEGEDWKWQQSPSLGLSFNQPLFQGPGVIRTDHAANTLEKAELDQTGTQEAYNTTRSQLLLQGVRLFHMRQSLLENRWILQEQIELARNDLEQAKADLKRGVISSLQLRREELDFDELLLDLADINKEISQAEISIEEIWNGDIRKILELLMMPDGRVTEFIQDGEFRLIENGELYNRVLKHDSDYQTALREKRKAELDKMLGSPADAPRLGLALNLSPKYPAGETGSPDLGESFTKLFSSDSNPTLSFSVTLQVPDLLRKQKEFTSAVQKEQMKQTEAKLAEAVLGVQETLRDLQARIRSQYLSLAIVFEEFKIAEGDFQQEQRRLESGLSNQTLLRQRGLAAYRAAFHVMQSLRELSILSLELDLLQGGNF